MESPPPPRGAELLKGALGRGRRGGGVCGPLPPPLYATARNGPLFDHRAVVQAALKNQIAPCDQGLVARRAPRFNEGRQTQRCLTSPCTTVARNGGALVTDSPCCALCQSCTLCPLCHFPRCLLRKNYVLSLFFCAALLLLLLLLALPWTAVCQGTYQQILFMSACSVNRHNRKLPILNPKPLISCIHIEKVFV